MYRLTPILALMMAASGSYAAVKAPTLGIEPTHSLDHSILLAQGPRGPGGPDEGPYDFRGPGGPYPYPPGGPRGPGGPGFYPGPGPGPGPGPRPAPPPDPGPAGIIPHILPLLLPPPRP